MMIFRRKYIEKNPNTAAEVKLPYTVWRSREGDTSEKAFSRPPLWVLVLHHQQL